MNLSIRKRELLIRPAGALPDLELDAVLLLTIGNIETSNSGVKEAAQRREEDSLVTVDMDHSRPAGRKCPLSSVAVANNNMCAIRIRGSGHTRTIIIIL